MNSQHQKAYKGMGMEGWIARWYTRTRGTDMEDFRRQAQAVAEQLPAGAKVLEVAPGPGFFAIELAKLGNFQITGLDISQTFVQIATERAQSAGVEIDFRLGNVSAMPFADESFDFIYCSAAFKNFSEPIQALNEMHRVLCPGAQAVVLDLRKDTSLDEINSYVKQSGRKRIDAWITSWTFRWLLIKRAYTQDEFRALVQQCRFGTCKIKFGPIGFEAQLTKTANAAVSA